MITGLLFLFSRIDSMIQRYSPCRRTWVIAILVAFGIPISRAANSSPTLSDDTLSQITFEQKLGAVVPGDLVFTNEVGREVHLADYFQDKPVILILGYYRCPMLCSLVLNGLVEGLQQIKWSIDREFEVLCISIDPHETPALAQAKRRTYLKRYARPAADSGWHYLVGSESSTTQISSAVGFQYAYDPATKQFAHPSGLVVLTPERKISGYMMGVTFPGKTLYASLAKAANNQIGSPVDRLILLCFHYNPLTGKYGSLIIRLVRILGAGTLVGLVILVSSLVYHRSREELKRSTSKPGRDLPPVAS